VHSGTPTGIETTIHGLNAYVASPAEGKQPRGVVVMIPDAFGWRMVNNRLLCDRYAAEGNWLVYLPDFMDGSLNLFFLRCI
jgi:dienelactone hydrolase